MKTKIKPSLMILMLSVFVFLAASPAAAQNENGVTLYERINQDEAGAHRSFAPGTYHQSAADIKLMLITSSIKVPDGYEVWLCDKPPGSGSNGGSFCESHFEGKYNLGNRISGRFTYLDVQYNRYVKTGNVCLFAGFDQMGLPLCFGWEGVQSLSSYKFEHPANFDLPNVGNWISKASSIWVNAGYSANVCTNARVIVLPNNQPTASNCTTYGPGEYNFNAAVNNQSTSVKIKQMPRTKVPPAAPPGKLPPGKKTPKIFLPQGKP